MYSLEQLNVFVTVCKSGSFSAAARKLGKAQSGISQTIANLEIELGQALFERSKNAVWLTKNGKALLPIMEDLLQQSHFLTQKAQALVSHHEEQLTIAFEESLLMNERLLSPFWEIQTRFPFTNINLNICPKNVDVIRKILKGEAHIGLLYDSQNIAPQLERIYLEHENFILVAAKQHPLAQLKEVSFNDLKQHFQLLHEEQMEKLISPHYWISNSYYVLYLFAAENIGWTILPENLLSDEWLGNWLGELTKLNLTFELSTQRKSVIALIAHNHNKGKVTEFLLECLKRER